MYKGGFGLGYVAECDLTPKQANKRYNELKTNARCGWVELVAEEEDEGEHMEILQQHDQIKLARAVSSIL
jgi:hypothetical protein